jgi:hypothetical protein
MTLPDAAEHIPACRICGCVPCICEYLRLVKRNPPDHFDKSEKQRLDDGLRLLGLKH